MITPRKGLGLGSIPVTLKTPVVWNQKMQHVLSMTCSHTNQKVL